ncbi:MAG: ATP-dependent 6-phosphofructokinase [Lacipirellulaceae bacterium]
MSKKRVGILTSGGDCPGLNAVIRGAVKACHQLGYDCVGFLKGYEGLYDPVQYVHLSPASTRGILNQGGTILGSTNKGRFAATVGVQDRQELDPVLMRGVKQTIEQLSIDGLICVGGDGSLAVAQQFHEQGIPVVGVPKTIDNDLSATAFTFGFDSAIECATDALDRLHTTAASHERIMVLEVMGRHAGWIALNSGIAGGGDVILIPEIDWTFEHVCHKILHRESQGKKFTLVVVAEGAELPHGGMVGEHRAGQQMKLGGIGRAVTDEIGRRLHRETRLCVLGHLQRGGRPTTFDRVLATQFGAHAVRLVKEGRFGEMICSRPPEMTSVPIIEAVNVLRTVEPHGPGVQAARALGISFGDRPADAIGEDVFAGPEAAASPIFATTAGAFAPALADEPSTEPAVERTPPEVTAYDAEHSLAETTHVAELVLEEAVAERTAEVIALAPKAPELPTSALLETGFLETEPLKTETLATEAPAEKPAPAKPADTLPTLSQPGFLEEPVADATATLESLKVEAFDEPSLDTDEAPVEESKSLAVTPETTAEIVEAIEAAEATVEVDEDPSDDVPETEAPETDASLELEIAAQVAEAQAALAERIAGMAQSSRDRAPESVKVDATSLEALSVDEALAMAPSTPTKEDSPATGALEFDVESLMKRISVPPTPSKAPAPIEFTSAAFDADVLAEAKAALEAALGK